MALLICFQLALLLFASDACAKEKAEVVIEGIEGAARDNVEKALTLPRDLVREGKVDRLWFERLRKQAEARTMRALEPFGYYSAEVKAETRTEDETFILHVSVKPGDPVRVRTIRVEVNGAGKQAKELETLVREFPLRKGDILLQQLYEQGKSNLKSQAEELGYLDARFTAHEIRIIKAEASAAIDLVMDTGPHYLFGPVEISGAPQYPQRILRRFIPFRTGDSFSYAKLGEAQLNYANSERFRQVTIRPEKEEAVDNRVPISVELDPVPRRTLNPGVGYGTDTGARFSIRYRDLNLWQLAHDFTANLFISEVLQGFAAQYTIPSARDVKSSTAIQLNLQREEVDTYTSSLAALEVNRNRTFRRGQIGTLYLRIQQEWFTVGEETSSSRLVLPGVRFAQERYDSLLRPRSGHRVAFDIRGTHQYLGSNTGLIQLIVEGSRLLPLPWRSSIFFRGRGAFTAQNDPLAELPASLRFFAGGEQSVRGYSYQSLGPRNASGTVVGGRHLAVGSVEVFRDVFENFAVSAFYDAGNAFNDLGKIHLYHGTGIGLHYYSPVGAINLALARQVAIEDPGFHVHFSVGFQF